MKFIDIKSDMPPEKTQVLLICQCGQERKLYVGEWTFPEWYPQDKPFWFIDCPDDLGVYVIPIFWSDFLVGNPRRN